MAGTAAARSSVRGRAGQRHHVLEVAVDELSVGDRVGDRETAVQERVGLPHEVVVEVLARLVGEVVDGQREDEDGDPDPRRIETLEPRPERGRRPTVAAAGAIEGRCYTALHLVTLQEVGWTDNAPPGWGRPELRSRRVREVRERPSPALRSCSSSVFSFDSCWRTSCCPAPASTPTSARSPPGRPTLAQTARAASTPRRLADYPPGYLYVLWLSARSAAAWPASLAAPTSSAGRPGDADTIVAGLIKMPAILPTSPSPTSSTASSGLARSSSRRERAALVAAGIYLFNPVTWYDSALWGQTDAVGTLVTLVAIAVLIDGYSEAAVGASPCWRRWSSRSSASSRAARRRDPAAPPPLPARTRSARDPVPRALRGWFSEEQASGASSLRRPWRRCCPVRPHHPVRPRHPDADPAHGPHRRRLHVPDRQRL